tara:strand:+ start:691 stop:963 length:273 start_codon:yes stop_codon:yes gene_type:complete
MIRRKVDNLFEHKTCRLKNTSNVIRRHPHLGLWASGFSQNDGVFARQRLPIYDSKSSGGSQYGGSGARQFGFVGDPMKSIGDQHKVDLAR